MLSEKEKNELRKQRDLDQAIRESIIRQAAFEYEEDGAVEIDGGAVVSVGEDGAYVQAWVYVSADDVQLPDELKDWPSDCANPVTVQELQDALSALLREFKITYGQDFYKNAEAKAAAILLARMKGSDPIEDQTCYLRGDL